MNLLWSYAYARKVNLDLALQDWAVPEARFFADSGAHSARTLGIHIDLPTYAAWVRKWAHCFTVYANLDVIYGAARTWDNQRALEDDYGLHPMPVFHTGEPWTALERYLEAGYTYIALGKLLGNPWSKLRPWLHKAFRMAGDTAVFHGFGLTAWPAIRDLPFYSVDSSSWGSPYRYGTLRLFDHGRWVTVRVGNRESVRQHWRLLESYDAHPGDLARMTGSNRLRLARFSAEAYMRAGEWVAAQHGPIKLPPGKGYPPIKNHRLPGGTTILRPGHANRFVMYLAETVQGTHGAHATAVNQRGARLAR